MKLLMIDNFDSFTYNLVQYLGEMGHDLHIYRNDQLSMADIREIAPDAILISPGPGHPDEVPFCLNLIKELGPHYPILGVCLGHQMIARAFGGLVISADQLVHGKTALITHDGHQLFEQMPSPFPAARYHSLIADPDTLPSCLKIIARSADGDIMAIQHQVYPLFGVQFHPESYLTPDGKQLLSNFLTLSGRFS